MKGGPGDTGNKHDRTWRRVGWGGRGRGEQEHQGLPGSSEIPQKKCPEPWEGEPGQRNPRQLSWRRFWLLSVLRFLCSV